MNVAHILQSKKLRDLCDSVGMECSGSEDDIINALHELLLFKEVMPKMYKQIKNCAGISICCALKAQIKNLKIR